MKERSKQILLSVIRILVLVMITLGVDGTYTVSHLNSNSVVASTTGNITGI